MKFRKMLPMLLIILFEAAVGVLLLIDGEAFTRAVLIIFGALLMVLGLVMLFRFIGDRREEIFNPLALVIAVIAIAVGAVFAFGSSLIIGLITLITLIYGVIMAINGVFKLVDYFTLRKAGAPVSGFTVFSAVLAIALGIVIVINPFGTDVALWMVMGIVLIVEAVMDIIALIMAARLSKTVEVEAEEIATEDVD